MKNKTVLYQSKVCKENSKSFYFASLLFPKKVKEQVHIFYAFARVCDDLIDEARNKEQQNKNIVMLDEIIRIMDVEKKKIDKLFDLVTQNHEAFTPITPDKELNATTEQLDPLEICNFSKILLDFNSLVTEKKIPIWVLKLLMEGFKHDSQTNSVLDEGELLRYCLGVASSIGLTCCFIFGVTSEEAQVSAASLGIAMQLTNISRDILTDSELSRTYIPDSWLKAVGLTPDEFLKLPAKTKQTFIKPLALDLISLAEIYYEDGWKGLKYLPMKIRLAIAAAALVYREIGMKIKQRLEKNKTYPKRSFTTKGEKIRLSLRAILHVLFKTSPRFLVQGSTSKCKSKQVLDAFKTDFVFAVKEESVDN